MFGMSWTALLAIISPPLIVLPCVTHTIADGGPAADDGTVLVAAPCVVLPDHDTLPHRLRLRTATGLRVMSTGKA